MEQAVIKLIAYCTLEAERKRELGAKNDESDVKASHLRHVLASKNADEIEAARKSADDHTLRYAMVGHAQRDEPDLRGHIAVIYGDIAGQLRKTGIESLSALATYCDAQAHAPTDVPTGPLAIAETSIAKEPRSTRIWRNAYARWSKKHVKGLTPRTIRRARRSVPECMNVDEIAIPRLALHRGFLNDAQQREIVERIDQQPWSKALRRRTQHYGFTYSYDRRPLVEDDFIGLLPTWMTALAQSFPDPMTPDQAIVNEYLAGQGISTHIDHVRNFGPVIASVSLIGRASMEFSRAGQRRMLELLPGDVLVLTGDARYRWTHEISTHLSRRLSLTFRTVQLHA